MTDRRLLSTLEPLLVGRATRVLFGIATFVLIAIVSVESLGVMGTGILCFLGVSFLIGGIVANPGCEITAIPNLFLSEEKRVHSV